MKIGQIKGSSIGRSRSIGKWAVTAKKHTCGICEKIIPALTLAYRQTILEGRRFSRSYTYCRTCTESTGRKPPQGAVKREKAQKEKEGQRSLFTK